MPEQLHWERKSAGRWVLKAANGEIWAAVVPYRSEYACKNQFKGAVIGSARNSFAISRWGKIGWTTGLGVPAAKRNVVDRLRSGCYHSISRK